MPAASLRVAGLAAGWGETRVIEALDLSVGAGARLAILGRNGAGKTTLLAAAAGLARRFAGSIRLDGREIGDRPIAERALAGLGYVPQTRDVFPSLTVEENLSVGLKDRPWRAIEEAYALFPALRRARGRRGGLLSGGEQQMLSIARSLLGQPRMLLLDEPLEGLAPKICDELMAALDAIAGSGRTTVVLVEQQIERALAFADAALVMERGAVAWSGPSAALLDDPARLERHLGVAMRPSR